MHGLLLTPHVQVHKDENEVYLSLIIPLNTLETEWLVGESQTFKGSTNLAICRLLVSISDVGDILRETRTGISVRLFTVFHLCDSFEIIQRRERF